MGKDEERKEFERAQHLFFIVIAVLLASSIGCFIIAFLIGK